VRQASLAWRVFLVAGSVAGCLYAVVLAWAAFLFREDTSQSIRDAVRLIPYNADYLQRLSVWDPANKIALLERAVQVNPFSSRSWIALGLAQEFEKHDLREAERCYREAANVDHMYLPRWTLANFYFRRERMPEFFHWARAALEITPYSPAPLFEEMWRASQDGKKLASMIPDRSRTLLQYAWFLSNSDHDSELPAIVARLTRTAPPHAAHLWGRDDLLAAIIDRLTAEGKVTEAMGVWQALSKAQWIAVSAPDPEHPLTNGNFRSVFYEHGFDWKANRQPGIAVEQLPSEGTLLIQFSGDEPERAVLLTQYIPVRPGGQYRLTWKAQGDEKSNAIQGLHWQISPVPFAGAASEESPDLLGDPKHSWQFRVGGEARELLLSLRYERPLGEVRARGEVRLTSVSIEMVGSAGR
jgi:tetratricopeptide (TPR) repeat protein